MSAEASCGPREFPTLLLEDSRKNLIDEPEDFGQWNTAGGLTRSSGQDDPYGGTAAWRLEDGTTAQQGDLTRTFTVDVSTQATLAVFVKPGTTPSSTGSRILLRSTGGTDFIDVNIVFSSGIPAMSFAGNQGEQANPDELWRGGWWRLAPRSTGNLSTGTYTVFFVPANTTGVGDIFVHGLQLEV